MEQTNNKKGKGLKIFILLITFAIAIFFGKGFIDKMAKNDEKTLQIVYKIPATADTMVKFYNEAMVKYENNTLVGIGKDGTTNWEKNVNFDKPIVFLGKERIYISEGITGDIYLIDENGNSLNRIMLNRPIDNVIEKGNLLYVLSNDEKSQKIALLNQDGQLLWDTVLDNIILNFATNKTSTKTIISTLNISENSITTTLSSYDDKGTLLGSIKFEDEIITFLDFKDEDLGLVLTDKGLYSVKDNSVLWKKEYTDIKDIYLDLNEEIIYLLYGKDLETMDLEGKVIDTIELEGDFRKIYPYKSDIILAGKKEVIGFNKGKQYLRYDLEEQGEIIVDGVNIIQITTEKINVMKVITKD